MNRNQAKKKRKEKKLLFGRNIRKRPLLKQACLSKSAAEVDGLGTLLLIPTPHVK